MYIPFIMYIEITFFTRIKRDTAPLGISGIQIHILFSRKRGDPCAFILFRL